MLIAKIEKISEWVNSVEYGRKEYPMEKISIEKVLHVIGESIRVVWLHEQD